MTRQEDRWVTPNLRVPCSRSSILWTQVCLVLVRSSTMTVLARNLDLHTSFSTPSSSFRSQSLAILENEIAFEETRN